MHRIVKQQTLAETNGEGLFYSCHRPHRGQLQNTRSHRGQLQNTGGLHFDAVADHGGAVLAGGDGVLAGGGERFLDEFFLLVMVD